MKKFLVLVLGAVVLAGCGSSEKTVTCKYEPSKSASGVADITYDGDKKITSMNLKTEMEIPSYVFEDKDTLKTFKKSLEDNIKDFDVEGVTATFDLNEDDKKAVMEIKINKKAITKDNASTVGFYYTKDVKKAVSNYEDQGFTCGKVE